MLSIRMQRLGRKGHPMYRIVVQDSRRTPNSGKFVAMLGSYDPHNKTSIITKDKAEFYLSHGAQPSDRVVRLFKTEKISLPKWVDEPAKRKREIKNPDKLRKNRPVEEKAPEPAAEETAESTPNAETASQSTADQAEVSSSQPDAEEKADEAPEIKADETDKDEAETKTPPAEDEFPEDKDKKTEA